MSKKLFSIKYDTISTNYPSGRIFDNEKQHNLYIDEVVNLLNWLSNENKEFKQENGRLKEKIREQQSIITKLNNQIEQLNLAIDDLLTYMSCDGIKKQNEQLQRELDSFKPVMFQDMRKVTIILYSKGDTDE